MNFLQHLFGNISKGGPKADGGRLFVMDNDPSQTSRASNLAIEDIEGRFHEIPHQSPDLNPIDNIFHLVKLYSDCEAICRNVVRESFDEFNV